MGFQAFVGFLVLAATLGGEGGLFYIWTWAESAPSGDRELRHFLTDIVSLPLGVFAIFLAVVNWYYGGPAPYADLMVGVGGLLLLAKVLSDLPWTSIVGLALGGVAGYAVWYYAGAFLPWYGPLLAGGVVFMVVTILLVPAEGFFKVLGLLLLPRPFLILIGSFLLAEGVILALTGSVLV